ncbi:DUF3558 domain-containing protein [Streptomyces sp. MST-110588]|uniref:DUF3558 domain-containing protein n=1 Tax=Streptomyces sp. MST-110588 TaxID=2833628 RepID=UPI001F5E2C4B|nr:DUF3558 domain-containing protein [Streptomyces sp. MST-110588]UNO41229.1 DUF3558 domain-containing protein [Streptomyces sp. MST-110588]
MHRSAKRLTGLLACAAVPVMLVAGCSDSDKKDAGPEASKTAAPSSSKGGGNGSSAPGVAPAKYKKLPDPCAAVSKDTIKKLLPKAEDEAGTRGKSSDASARGYCSWKSSDNQGLKGTQYRWMDIRFHRYDSDPTVGSGDKRATDFYNSQIDTAKGTPNAKNVKTSKADGVGDEATSVTYDLKKDDNDFKNQTVVSRLNNVVVTLNFNGSGLAGAKAPDRDEMLKDAQNAAKEAVAAVAKANR